MGYQSCERCHKDITNEAQVHVCPVCYEAISKRIVELEARVAYAEDTRDTAFIARDNAIVMRDEVMAQKKQAGESAGRRIEALIRLGRHYAQQSTPVVGNALELFEHDLAAILSKDAPSPIEKKPSQDPPPSLDDRIVTFNGTMEAMRSEYALKNNMSVEDVVIVDGKPEYRRAKRYDHVYEPGAYGVCRRCGDEKHEGPK